MDQKQAGVDALAEVLARMIDDYLDECGSIEDVDSVDLGQQLAAAVVERRMPQGVYYVPNGEAMRAAWGH